MLARLKNVSSFLSSYVENGHGVFFQYLHAQNRPKDCIGSTRTDATWRGALAANYSPALVKKYSFFHYCGWKQIHMCLLNPHPATTCSHDTRNNLPCSQPANSCSPHTHNYLLSSHPQLRATIPMLVTTHTLSSIPLSQPHLYISWCFVDL